MPSPSMERQPRAYAQRKVSALIDVLDARKVNWEDVRWDAQMLLNTARQELRREMEAKREARNQAKA